MTGSRVSAAGTHRVDGFRKCVLFCGVAGSRGSVAGRMARAGSRRCTHHTKHRCVETCKAYTELGIAHGALRFTASRAALARLDTNQRTVKMRSHLTKRFWFPGMGGKACSTTLVSGNRLNAIFLGMIDALLAIMGHARQRR